MTTWTWHIRNPSGGRELTAARARRLNLRLRSASEATFTIDGRHEEAAEIDELVTDLLIRRDGRLIYRGRVGATTDNVSADGHTVEVATADLRQVLRRRILYDDDTLEWISTDKATIASELIDQTQARVAGDLGIDTTVDPLGVAVDHSFQAGASIGEAVQELAEEGDGFDWDIDPDSLQLQVWSQRGSAAGVVLDVGGLVASVHRGVDPSTHANAIRVNGADGLLDIETREAADLAARPEGRWDAQHGFPTVLDAATLVDKADWQINEAQTLQPAYTVTLRPGKWAGPTHIGLGDTCRLVARSGRLDVNTLLRVYEIPVDIDDDGQETVSLQLGAARTLDVRRLVAAQTQRLDQLARR